MTICSLVVHTRPENLTMVSSQIEKYKGLEIHGCAAEGKLVVTIDHPDRTYCSETMMAMAKMEGVVNTSLVYEYYEAESEPSVSNDNKNFCLTEVS